MQSDWPRGFLHLTQEQDFSQTRGFNKMIKVIMVHDLNPKDLTINGLEGMGGGGGGVQKLQDLLPKCLIIGCCLILY